MKKPLLLSLVTAALLTTSNLGAASMFERFEAMEKEMNALKQQVAELKSQKSAPADEDEDEEEGEDVASADEADDEEAEDEEETGAAGAVVASDDEDDDEEDGDEVASADDDEDDELATNEERIEELEEMVDELSRATSGNHLKFGIDYRFAIENMNYDMADGSEQKNDAFMTNRLWINMGYKATNNLSFKGQLAYNKAFGARSGASTPASNSYETFDWIANENAYDDQIRVRSAYFLWQEQEFFGLDVPWTFSIGRRPSTGGHLANLREDDQPNSPLGHAINVEFDGLSSKFTLYKPWKTYIKLCAGRGMSNAQPRFSGAPYAKDDTANSDIDLAGLIFVPYDDNQYKISTQYYYASNLIDAVSPANQTLGFDTVGGLRSLTGNLTIHGIGEEWSDFLDETIFFVSGAMSITDPDEGQGMLGSEIDESVTGYSYWIGTQFPSLISEDGRWGMEFNHGSKYWRAITYGEDTNVGSKLAARGDAYEAYMTEYLVDDILSIQLRYTYIDYDYAGSNGFFGNSTGDSSRITSNMPGAANYVDKAQDIRFYIRYRY